jgi:hypothetical protein
LAENDKDKELDKARDKKTTSTNRGAKALDNLASSALKAAGAIYGTLPKSLTDVFGDKALGGSLSYLERNLDVMRGFTTYGVDFGNAVDDMIVSATASRIGLDGYAKIVGQSGSSLLMFGETANQGMQKFIAGQTNFFAKFTEEERTLKRLGFTVDEITDTFLTYDKVSNYARVRTDRTDQQRNRAAVEFSLELDRLSKLTGKQREALKEQMIEVGRAGDVQARTNQLTTDAGKDSLTRSITNAKQFGPMVGKLAQDILTAGIPKGASRQVAGLAGEFTSSLYELRDAQMRGNAEEIKIAEQRVEQQAALLRENKTIQQLAIYSGLNAYTDISAGILESTAEGPARAYEIAKQQLIKEGKVATDEVVRARVAENIAKEQAKAIADGVAGSTQLIQQSMIDVLTNVQQTAAAAQISGTKELFKELSGPISGFSTLLDKLNLPSKIEDFNKFFTDMIGGLRGLTGDVAAQGNVAAKEALARGSNELSRELFDLARRVNEATGPEKVDLEAQLKEAMKKVGDLKPLTNMLVDADNATIIPDQTFIDEMKRSNEERGRPNKPPGNRDTGSLGKTGRLFENFGKQTNMLLHGIESVQTPEQTAEIMRHSAIGTAQAFADSLRGMQGMEAAAFIKTAVVPAIEQMSGSTVQTLGGMLNTLKATSTTNTVAAQPQQIDPAIMEQLLSKLASNIKGPMEEALKGLKSPMEDFASTAREQLAIQQKQLRGIKGMSGDAMRGLG